MAKNYAGSNALAYLINLIKTALGGKLDKTDVVNNLLSDDSTKALSAAQGKALKELIGSAGGGDMMASDYDRNGDHKVDAAEDADKLGGQLPSYYETAGAGQTYVTSVKGQANGLAPLGPDKKVPAENLPSYVDDVVEGYLHEEQFYEEEDHTHLIPGEEGKIYVDLGEDGGCWRYSGSKFVKITSDDMVEIENGEVQRIWTQTFGG